MRVLLNNLRNRRERKDERGATVVVVAMITTVLLVISAFTLDFGMAFVGKRNLQKAADAGALAAAQVLTQFPGTCNNVASNSTARTAAQFAANRMRQSNREAGFTDSRQVDFDIKCDPDLKVLLVEYQLEGDTTSFFGQLAGGDDTITTTRQAEATVDVAPGARRGMRPLALCSASFDPGYMDRSGDFVRIHFPGAGRVPPESCDVDLSGNWWLLDCPEERTGSANELRLQIRNGCQGPVSVIPGQTDATTPGALTVVLEDACPEAEQDSETCMSGNPGNITQGGNSTFTEWTNLADRGEESLFPVFCAPIDCSAVTAGGNGTNAVFPVYKLVSAIVCGFHFDASNRHDSTHANCNGNPYLTAGDNTTNNYFVFKLIQGRVTGTTEESDCALGAECDGGLRRTRLTR